MTAPTTAAGRELLDALGKYTDPDDLLWLDFFTKDSIAAIEAEAANAEHERLASEWVTPSEEAKRRQDAVHEAVAAYRARIEKRANTLPPTLRAAVLAAIEETE